MTIGYPVPPPPLPPHAKPQSSLIPWPPQIVLTNVAMLAENGQLLLEARLPEEFLVPVGGGRWWWTGSGWRSTSGLGA